PVLPRPQTRKPPLEGTSPARRAGTSIQWRLCLGAPVIGRRYLAIARLPTTLQEPCQPPPPKKYGAISAGYRISCGFMGTLVRRAYGSNGHHIEQTTGRI